MEGIQSTYGTSSFQDADDQLLLQECGRNIIKHLDRLLKVDREDHSQISRLLSMRWFISNEISPKTN